MVIAIKYFTRRIEAKPLASITLESVKKFFWQNIICRFGVPRTLTVDNSKQFDSDRFREFCQSIGTCLAFASVYHPESNGAVERANRTVFLEISKTLLTFARDSGLKNYQRSSGHTTKQHPEQQASHHSSFCTAKSLCFQKKSSTKAFA